MLNYLSAMSSANVLSLKMFFYSVLKFQVNQDSNESSLMMLQVSASSALQFHSEVGEAERALQDLDDFSLVYPLIICLHVYILRIYLPKSVILRRYGNTSRFLSHFIGLYPQ